MLTIGRSQTNWPTIVVKIINEESSSTADPIERINTKHLARRREENQIKRQKSKTKSRKNGTAWKMFFKWKSVDNRGTNGRTPIGEKVFRGATLECTFCMGGRRECVCIRVVCVYKDWRSNTCVRRMTSENSLALFLSTLKTIKQEVLVGCLFLRFALSLSL